MHHLLPTWVLWEQLGLTGQLNVLNTKQILTGTHLLCLNIYFAIVPFKRIHQKFLTPKKEGPTVTSANCMDQCLSINTPHSFHKT
jgi:hypothetical protein